MTTIKASGRDLELRGDQDIVFYPTDNIWISQGTKLIFEGTVPDDHEAKLQATAVTADRDIIIPDASGTLTLNEKLTDGTFDMNVNSLTVTGSGATSVIQASQDIELDATGAVIVKDTPLRLASLTTTQRNALTPVNGDMIYNTTTNKIEMYTNGAWGSTATVEGLVDSAPGTLDTLNELAAALGDDPNFATTTANNIATKWTQDNTKISNWDTSYTYSQVGHVPLAGGTMTGLLTLSGAPTANLHAATKQYVDTQISTNSGGGSIPWFDFGSESQALNTATNSNTFTPNASNSWAWVEVSMTSTTTSTAYIGQPGNSTLGIQINGVTVAANINLSGTIGNGRTFQFILDLANQKWAGPTDTAGYFATSAGGPISFTLTTTGGMNTTVNVRYVA